ncbi:MAG: hypothetical protein ACKOVB_10250 [Terrabacter sp.]
MRRTTQAVAVLALAGTVNGCSVYHDFTTSDFAQQDADAIAAAASKAMQDVQSVRLTGQVRSRGNQYFIDLRMDRDDNCAGTMRFGSSNIDIRRVGDRVWLKGESGAYNRLSSVRLPDSVLDELSTSWVLLEDDQGLRKACDLEAFLDAFDVVDLDPGDDTDGGRADGKADQKAAQEAGKKGGKKAKGGDDLSGDVPTTVGDETTEDGQKVVQLSGSPGGQHEELAWVRSDAPHYVVRIESTSAQDGGSVALTEFDADVEVEVPKAKDVFVP